MLQLEVVLINGSRIDLDLIFRFRRKNIDYLNASDVLKSRQRFENGLWLASERDNQKYIQRFYALNQAEIPDKYVNKEVVKPADQIRSEVYSLPENKGFRKLVNSVAYLFELVLSMQQDQGFLITFSGVDGAGKSTVIEAVKSELEKKHRRRVVVLRHRPSILPIISAWKYGKKQAEEISVSNLPRQGKNSGKLSSLIRFFYYLIDYSFGQWLIHFRHVRKGTIVLYDRYYFDFINDSRRSNIALSPAFTSRFYFLIKKPQFNYFLWAPADVILERKKELDRDTIEALTSRYIRLFSELQKKDATHLYQCIKNLEIGETVSIIMRNITHKPHETDFYQTHSPSKS
jgi:thymidylate kinase